MLTDPGRVPLASRAWIADGVTGALVAADGTIDWWCPTGFDAPPACYRLLDPAGGAIRVGPVREGTGVGRRLPASEQHYLGGSMVAVTEMAAGGGHLRLVDLLPWSGTSVAPARRLVRLATALAGPIDVEVEVIPGEAWRTAPVSAWSEGLAMGHLLVRTGFPLDADPVGRDLPRWRGVRRLDAGQSLVVTVDDARADGQAPLSADAAGRLVDDTVDAWRSWLAPLAYSGPHRFAVERSALAVRSLTAPGGAVLSAGTTSLPRLAGGERTADDRVVRLREAAAAARSLSAVGLTEDAEAAERWLRQAIDGAPLPWPAAVAPGGGLPPEEEQLPLAGWRRSQPVVIGARRGLVDLDLYGDVMAAVSASQGGPWGGGGAGPLAGAPGALAGAADWVADHWTGPDSGVWACVGRPARRVASAAQAWVALDRSARRAAAANPLDLAAAGWHTEARAVVAWLEAEAADGDGALGAVPGGVGTDAALLRLAWQGPWPVAHPVVEATVDRILQRLASGPYLHRVSEDVDDGRPGPDSPDLLATLWSVRALCTLHRWEEAHERMDAVTGLGGTLGILSEAVDPLAGELLGNLPSSGVHLALLDAAAALVTGPA